MMRIMFSGWLLISTLLLASVCFAKDATRTGQFEIAPPTLDNSGIGIPNSTDPQGGGDGVHEAEGELERLQKVTKGVNNVIVRFHPNSVPLGTTLVPAESRFGGLSAKSRAVMGTLGAKISKSLCDGRVSLITLGPGVDPSVALNRLRAVPQVRFAVPDDSVILAEVIPNDPRFGDQWALRNTLDVDIDATLAWDQTTGSGTTLVAVMDTGIDYTHPDLYLSIAINNAEIPSSLRNQLVDTNSDGQIDFYDLNSLDAMGNLVLDSSGQKFNRTLVIDHNGNGYIDAGDLMVPPWSDGVDTDGNGLVDDLTGWDYLSNGNNPMDTWGHGTHIAGVISARGNNGVGIAGVNWRARIVPERFHNGGGTISDAIQAIDHAVSLGADVINVSWGVLNDNPALKAAIEWAGENGVVFVAAAGNYSENIDNPSNAYYPAAYHLPNLISVASVDPGGSLSDFSNYGPNSVDIAAPGTDILSTVLGGDYVPWSGTSMATPHVGGVVSLLVGLFPDKSPEWLVDRVLSTAKPLAGLVGKTRTGGMVNAFSAVNSPNVSGPRIVTASPTGDVVTPTDRVVLTFDRPIAANSFTTDDVSIIGPDGSVVPTGVSRLTDFVFEVVFPVQTTLGDYGVQVGPEIEDTVGRLMDQDGDGITGEPLDDRFNVVFRHVPPRQIGIIDDGDPGFSATGGWTTYNGVGAQGDFVYKPVGSGTAPATWTFANLAPGQYRVSTTWQAYSNRVVDAPYSVLDGSMELATVFVNQRQAPAGFVEGGVSWQDLGGPYAIAGGTLVVRLSDLASPAGSYLVGDAVRVERIGELPVGSEPEIQVLVDGINVADGTGSVNFGSTVIGAPVTRTITVRNAGTGALTLGVIRLPVGFSLATGFGATTVAPGQTTSFAVQMDAAIVGAFAGSISFDSNDADESPFDFGVSGTVSAQTTPQVWIIDDGEAGFSATGGWMTYNGVGAKGDFVYKAVGSGTATSTWTFANLAPGQYRVSTTWQAYSNRVVDAPCSVLDGSMELATVFVNQRQAPAGFMEGGVSWQDLGGPYAIAGGTLVVRLSDLASPAGSYLVGDAVRVERIGELPVGSEPEIQVLVDGINVADGTGSVNFGSTVIGAPVTKTITVRNVGTGALTLGVIRLPVGFSLTTGFGATTVAPGQTTSFAVQMDAAIVGAFAGSISFDSNDADESPFDFGVSGTVSAQTTPQVWIIDDGEAGFSATGGWMTYNGVGAKGDFVYKAVGSGTATSTWTFANLAPGQYRVSTTWQAYSNRVVDAPCSVLDGSMELATVFVNQRQAPAGFVEGGVSWQDLGGPYAIAGGTLVVRLSDLASPAGSYLVGDAVRVERIGELPVGSEPEIQVLVDGINVADGTGSVNFGSTVIGAPVTRTITVRNAGTGALTLGVIRLPVGFSLTTGFGATTVAPGQTTSFAVQMDAAIVGAFAGSISFDSNDADESPFDFGVSGTVSAQTTPQVWIIDDGEAGFSATGGWMTYNGVGAKGDFVYKAVGSGTATSTWTFANLAPGQYRVSTTWQAYSNRVVDAPCSVLDGSMELATVFVNQRQAPAGFVEGGVSWQDLGGPYAIAGGTLVVRLSDLASPAGSYLVGDAVRVERIGELPVGSEPEIQVLVDGINVADGTGSVNFGSTVIGAPVTRTITVRNAGTGALTLGVIRLPVGFSLATGFGATTVAPGQTTSFAVQMDAAIVGAFAGSISFDSNDADESPFDFGVSGTVSAQTTPQVWIIDDGEAGFSATGGWMTYNGVGAKGDFVYKAVGSGTATSTWTFANLAPGQYRVSTTWQAYSNRVVDAPYSVLDGSMELATVLVNQRQAPAGFLEGGVSWQDLGGPYDIAGGTLVVRLSDQASPSGSYLVGDALRVERIGDLP